MDRSLGWIRWAAQALAVTCGWGLVVPAQAEDAASGTGVGSTLDATRAAVHDAVYWVARGVDGWFGDIPFDAGGGKVTDGRVDLEGYRNEDGKLGVRLRFKANFQLPNLEKQAYAFVGRDNPREVTSDLPSDLTRQRELSQTQAIDNRFFAGVGRSVGDRFDLRAGVHGPFKPFVQARYREFWRPSERHLIEFRETAFASIDEHLGSTTVLSYEQSLSKRLLLRWLSGATITQVNPHFAWSSNLGVFKDLGGQRLFSLEAQISGTAGSGVPVGDYGVQTTWQQPIYKDWLLGEILVGRFWPQRDAESERIGCWIAGIYLKMRF
jgi:hypothetical protein